jgi:hypothetical protein
MIRYHTTLGILCQFVMCLGLINTCCKQSASPPVDYSGYYLPLDDFPAEGLVYTYRNLSDTSAGPEIWRHIKRGDGQIESINYGPQEEIVQRQFEKITSNGVMTDSLLLYFADSTGTRTPISVLILAPNKFPFNPGDSTKVWLTHLEWNQPQDSLHIVLQRRRRFKEDTTWSSHGKTVPAVRFTTEDTFETESDGWTTSTWTGEEVYAQGIGLVYYRRDISGQLSLEFELE